MGSHARRARLRGNKKTTVYPTLTLNRTPLAPLTFNLNRTPITTTTTVHAYTPATNHTRALPPALAARSHRFTTHSERPRTHPRHRTGTPHDGRRPVFARDIPHAAQHAHDADADAAHSTAAARALHPRVGSARGFGAP